MNEIERYMFCCCLDQGLKGTCMIDEYWS